MKAGAGRAGPVPVQGVYVQTKDGDIAHVVDTAAQLAVRTVEAGVEPCKKVAKVAVPVAVVATVGIAGAAAVGAYVRHQNEQARLEEQWLWRELRATNDPEARARIHERYRQADRRRREANDGCLNGCLAIFFAVVVVPLATTAFIYLAMLSLFAGAVLSTCGG